jgi:flagellar biosynthesis protein FlhF
VVPAQKEPELQPVPPEPGVTEVRSRLLRFGMTGELAERIVQRVQLSGAKGAYAIDAAAKAIGKTIPVQRSPKRSGAPHVLVFVGPTGAGKTATLAKLGRRLGEGGRRVLLASLDPVGASALETVGGVQADIDRAEIPLVTIRGEGDLRRAMRRYSNLDAVLVDTPGLSPKGEQELDQLGRELARIAYRHRSDTYLVLSATASRAALGLAFRAYARMRPTATVITKLDEAPEPTVSVEESMRYRLPLVFLCDGQDLRSHIVRPTPDRLADLLLRGKVA